MTALFDQQRKAGYYFITVLLVVPSQCPAHNLLRNHLPVDMRWDTRRLRHHLCVGQLMQIHVRAERIWTDLDKRLGTLNTRNISNSTQQLRYESWFSDFGFQELLLALHLFR